VVSRRSWASSRRHAFVVEQLGLPIAAEANKLAAGGHALVVEKNLEFAGGHHVTYRHELQGIPVRGEEVAVHLGSDNRVTGVTGTYHEAPADEARAAVPAGEAIQRALAHLGVRTVRQAPATHTMWVPVQGKLVLAHSVEVASAQPLGDFEVAVDANTGAILGGENQLCHATAEAKVYPHSPLDITMERVDLINMTAKNRLKGPYVEVINAKGDPADSPSGQFFYDKDDTHFAEVMIYHNLSKVHRYFKSFGYTGRDKVTKATVHYGNEYDNAFYSPMTDALAFGDGKKLNNLALEDNVAFHEFGHAVNRTITAMGGAEGGAMNEAFSDYFACAMNSNPLMGVWVMKKLNRPFMRNLENNRHYPEDIQNEVHRDGEIWGGAVWDVRKALGPAIADKLCFKSLYFLGSRPNFAKGLESLIAADKELFNGSHVAQLTQILNKRGIKASNQQPEIAGFRALKRQSAFLSLVNE
jgi:Zn-dependent metalloprotease